VHTTSWYIYLNFSTCFGQPCAHRQESLLYLCGTGIFHSVRVAVWSADQIATHTEWKIPVSHRYSKFSWWWTHSCPKHIEKFNKYLRSSVHLLGFIWKRLYRDAGTTKRKKKWARIFFKTFEFWKDTAMLMLKKVLKKLKIAYWMIAKKMKSFVMHHVRMWIGNCIKEHKFVLI